MPVSNADADIPSLAATIEDGGLFSITRSFYAQRVRHDAGVPVYSERAVCRSTQREVIAQLQEAFGGTTASRPSARRGVVFEWSARDRTAAEAAEVLLPFLQRRFHEASLVVALHRLKRSGGSGTRKVLVRSRRGQPVPMTRHFMTVQDVAERERLYRAMQALHRPADQQSTG